jgi:hypothetical protein
VSRDVVVAVVAVVAFGFGLWVSGWLHPGGRAGESARDSGRALERRRWRRLWTPALSPAIAIAILGGWRLQEPPVTDEPLTPSVLLFIVPLSLFAARCLWRSLRALRRPPVAPPIATVGLIRARISISPALHQVLDPAAMSAALAHEQAHARHRDPLRIFLAQMITDLQWPSPFARRRLESWLSALELARDEEARLAGAPGEDLAAAVVAVARLGVSSSRAVAGLTGAEASLAARVRRLLAPVPVIRMTRTWLAPLCLGLAIAIGVIAGATHGDAFMRALPFIAADGS